MEIYIVEEEVNGLTMTMYRANIVKINRVIVSALGTSHSNAIMNCLRNYASILYSR